MWLIYGSAQTFRCASVNEDPYIMSFQNPSLLHIWWYCGGKELDCWSISRIHFDNNKKIERLEIPMFRQLFLRARYPIESEDWEKVCWPGVRGCCNLYSLTTMTNPIGVDLNLWRLNSGIEDKMIFLGATGTRMAEWQGINDATPRLENRRKLALSSVKCRAHMFKLIRSSWWF